MTRFLIVLGFVIWFVAGLAVGWRIASPQDHPHGRPPRGGGWLAQQLNLTPQQQKQLDEIWQPIGRGGPSGRDVRMQLRRVRDAAIAALVPEVRKVDYQKIIDDYNTKTSAIESQWKQSFSQAVEKTKAILTPEQREKYEQLMSRARRDFDRDRSRSQHRPPQPPGPDEQPGTQPPSQEQTPQP